MNSSFLPQIFERGRQAYEWLQRAHEYGHYFAARQLGLDASFERGKAEVQGAGRWEHIAVLMTPTIPSLFLFLISVIGLFARFFLFKLFFLATLPATGALMAFCVRDWGETALALLSPYETDDAHKLLIISRLPGPAQEQISVGLRGHNVQPTWATTGQEIKQALSWRHYDMIIIDNALEKALAIATTLSKRRELAQTEIVVLEPHQDIHNLEEYL